MDFGSSRYADPDGDGYSDRYRNAYVDANTNADSDSNGYSHSYRDCYSYSDGHNDASAESYTNYDCERNTDLYSAA
jgi:hypothetical protein